MLSGSTGERWADYGCVVTGNSLFNKFVRFIVAEIYRTFQIDFVDWYLSKSEGKKLLVKSFLTCGNIYMVCIVTLRLSVIFNNFMWFITRINGIILSLE